MLDNRLSWIAGVLALFVVLYCTVDIGLPWLLKFVTSLITVPVACSMISPLVLVFLWYWCRETQETTKKLEDIQESFSNGVWSVVTLVKELDINPKSGRLETHIMRQLHQSQFKTMLQSCYEAFEQTERLCEKAKNSLDIEVEQCLDEKQKCSQERSEVEKEEKCLRDLQVVRKRSVQEANEDVSSRKNTLSTRQGELDEAKENLETAESELNWTAGVAIAAVIVTLGITGPLALAAVVAKRLQYERCIEEIKEARKTVGRAEERLESSRSAAEEVDAELQKTESKIKEIEDQLEGLDARKATLVPKQKMMAEILSAVKMCLQDLDLLVGSMEVSKNTSLTFPDLKLIVGRMEECGTKHFPGSLTLPLTARKKLEALPSSDDVDRDWAL